MNDQELNRKLAEYMGYEVKVSKYPNGNNCYEYYDEGCWLIDWQPGVDPVHADMVVDVILKSGVGYKIKMAGDFYCGYRYFLFRDNELLVATESTTRLEALRPILEYVVEHG